MDIRDQWSADLGLGRFLLARNLTKILLLCSGELNRVMLMPAQRGAHDGIYFAKNQEATN